MALRCSCLALQLCTYDPIVKDGGEKCKKNLRPGDGKLDRANKEWKKAGADGSRFRCRDLEKTDLLGAEDPVAGVAQTGDDVALLIQVIVQSTGIDIHVGVLLL